jgi:hypothetical protein
MSVDRKRVGLTVLLISVVVASYLRLANLGVPALWIDEVLLLRFTGHPAPQELIPQLAVWSMTSLFGNSEFIIRLPFALAGILTVAAIPLVIRKDSAYSAMVFVAVFPLLVFWSRVARPYAMAGLFIVLAWRWKWFMIPALLCTPIAILGANPRRTRSPLFWSAMVGIAFVSFLLRPDAGERNFFDLSFILTARRIWYVPVIAAVLWCADYLFDQRESRYPGTSGRGKGELVEQ